MSETIGNYWFSEVDLEKMTVIDEGILEEVCKLYSENYGVWMDSKSKITLSPKKFLNLHRHEIVYFVSSRGGNIIGMACVGTRNSNIKFITTLCVKKDFRRLGIGRSLIRYILSKIQNQEVWRIGIVSPNPISLLVLEGCQELSYIDLSEEINRDINFGIRLSILIDEFRRKSCGVNYKKSEQTEYRKIQTDFYVVIDESEIYDNLLEFYQNLMGTLEPGEEWILFCRYELRTDNKI